MTLALQMPKHEYDKPWYGLGRQNVGKPTNITHAQVLELYQR